MAAPRSAGEAGGSRLPIKTFPAGAGPPPRGLAAPRRPETSTAAAQTSGAPGGPGASARGMRRSPGCRAWERRALGPPSSPLRAPERLDHARRGLRAAHADCRRRPSPAGPSRPAFPPHSPRFCRGAALPHVSGPGTRPSFEPGSGLGGWTAAGSDPS